MSSDHSSSSNINFNYNAEVRIVRLYNKSMKPKAVKKKDTRRFSIKEQKDSAKNLNEMSDW